MVTLMETPTISLGTLHNHVISVHVSNVQRFVRRSAVAAMKRKHCQYCRHYHLQQCTYLHTPTSHAWHNCKSVTVSLMLTSAVVCMFFINSTACEQWRTIINKIKNDFFYWIDLIITCFLLPLYEVCIYRSS